MKTKINLLLIVFGIFFGCQQNTWVEVPKVKKGMIKFTIFYPNGEGKTFDMDYYANKHMPMAANLFGESLQGMSIDKGLANGTPDMPLQYLAIGSFYFADMSTFQNSMKLHSETLKADVPNYTNIRPITQISEVQTLE